MRSMKRLLRVPAFSLLLTVSSLHAGPPFQTDDPEPVAFRHGEVYFASQINQSVDGVSGTAPHLEVNYGALPGMQLHVIVPLAFNNTTENGTFYGFGDIEFGIKYRFVKEGTIVPQIGTFPHLLYPAGSALHGLGAAEVQVFLPLWLQKSSGPWTTYGGGGYWFRFKPRLHSDWFFGWEGQRDLSTLVTIGAEVFATTANQQEAGTEVALDGGAIINVSEQHHFLASLGSDIKGSNKILCYAAYQFLFHL